ncbi:MAG: hypothetical protein KDA81_20270, partial [Planctomycetaceae bacterium]|nr:hypothetical protein [Planctomycetaceae bacterium]
MSAGMISDGSQVQQVLDACRRHVRLHVVMSGLAGIVTVGLVCLLTAAVLDFLFDVPPTGRILLLAIGLLAVGHSCWTLLIRPLMTRLSDSEMGAAVDLAFPDLRERLATLVSIQRPEASGSETGSALMQQHLRDEVRDHLRQVEVQQVVDAHQTIRRCGVATGILLLSLLPVLLWPSGSRLLLQRLMNPFANLASATNLYFDIEDANRTVARGSTVRIAAAPRWRTATSGERPDQVQLQLVAEGGHTETLAMSFDEVSGCFIGEISRIAQSVQYQVSGGGARSELCRITVVDAPEIRSATMTVTPPVYTGRVVERIDGMIGEMEVFENSRMEIVLEFNKPVQSAEFVWVRRDQRPLTETELFDRRFDNITGEELVEEDPMAELVPVTEPLADRIAGEVSSDGTSALFHLTADVGGEFEFQIQDEHELPNAVEPERRIQVIYDQRPKLVVSGAADGDQFRPNDILPLNCLATDDIGIGLLELHYRRNDDVDLIEAAVSFDRGAAEVRHAFRLDLKDMQLSSGDRLTLQVRTADERPDPGPQEVWSEPIQIVIDENARAAGAKALEEETQAMLDSLKALEAQLRKDSENARELKNSTHADWNQEKREQTQRLSEKEQQQGRFLEELATEVATHPLMKDSAEQLQQLSGEVRDEVSAELQQAVTEDRREAGEHLHQSSEQLKQSADRLQQEIEKIEEAARLEQDLAELNRLALEAEQLARESRELDDDRRDPTRRPEETSEQQWQDQLNQRQQELAQEQQELAQDLEQLLRDQNELLDAAQRSQQEQLQELAREVEELARDQRRLAQGIQEEAQEVTRDARQVADKLQQVRRDAERFNRDVEQNAPDASRADLAALDEAVQQLRQGNLATPQNNVSQVADELNESRQQLQQPPSDNDADDPVPADAETSDAGKTKPAAEDKVAAGESASDSEKLPQNLPSINSPDGTPPGDGKPGEVAPADAAPGDAKPAEVAQQDSNGDPKAQPASAKPSPSDSEPTSKGEPAANGESTTKGEPAAAAQANSDSPPSTAGQ